MNNAVRKAAFVIGIGLLIVSMYWSQDGWNFNVAGDSGYGTMALFIGWFLAVTVSVVQFVFSSSFRELNASLKLFGILAYSYSIYTNYEGILHFQGDAENKVAAMLLGIVMDGVPEPLIAWSLGESLTGDFVGNLIKSFMSPFNEPAKNTAFQTKIEQNRPGIANSELKFGDLMKKMESSKLDSNTETQPRIYGLPKLHGVNHPKNSHQIKHGKLNKRR